VNSTWSNYQDIHAAVPDLASAVIQIEKSFIKETILKLEEHPN
jgi:hypothetical protein